MASIGQELLNVPFGDMVMQLALAIAEGQYKMDKASCEIAAMMGDVDKAPVVIPTADGSEKVSMIGAGFQPTFYQFTDTIIEVKISITMSKSTEASVSAKVKCFCASVNASYSSKYSYSVEGSSLIRTKITPVPPNEFLQKLLELKLKVEQKKYEKLIGDLEEAAGENEEENKEGEGGSSEDTDKNSKKDSDKDKNKDDGNKK
ncbi:hypothetical protein SAMN02910298_00805 [Pseudobutyrivibrio sp. YE44]|uniref:hypothetical protein n=1 Tax=Pseudobutyrivibrio sp. YE44 TaxID=1520802 RepID=UPI00088E5C3C|nr:hypothetical protein [Pseudobutyrivibrio sp. YE44]SDB15066.1 hypothetical protein SAMN02910298_00805 [Pseudobutyrivibrio sp. YE44]